MKLETRIGEVRAERHHSGSHGPRIRQASTGATLPVVPIAAGLVALFAIVYMNFGWLYRLHPFKPDASAPAAEAKTNAAVEAEQATTRFLNKAAVSFGQVWATAPHTACGYVGAEGLGQRRFIFANGAVTLDDRSSRFVQAWGAKCGGAGQAASPGGRATAHHRHKGARRAE